jgi:glucose/arabinose dehydrogenase
VLPRTTRRRASARIVALTIIAVAIAVAALWTTVASRATAAPAPRLALEQAADVQGTTAMAVRAGDPALYVTLQSGRVVAIRPGGATETVLDLTSRVASGGERGLLGLAFSPDGTRLYVHYSGVEAGETVVDEYTFADGRVDPATRRLVLTVPQPQLNHNGGQLEFGPDGMLYLGLGDGGNRDDTGPGHAPGGNAQSLDTLLGKILRIDPQPSAGRAYTVPADNPFADRGRPEIYVYGMRNPWRFSFDPATNDLWIADVGQDEYEEVTRLPAATIAGANLGWPRYDASHEYRSEAGNPSVVMPQIETNHADGNCSITGGYVYRGTRIPALRGWYLFTDYCNGRIEAAKVSRRGTRIRDVGVELTRVSSFGRDGDGELYVLSQDRGVYRIVAP